MPHTQYTHQMTTEHHQLKALAIIRVPRERMTAQSQDLIGPWSTSHQPNVWPLCSINLDERIKGFTRMTKTVLDFDFTWNNAIKAKHELIFEGGLFSA